MLMGFYYPSYKKNAHRGDCIGSVHARVANVRLLCRFLKNPNIRNCSAQWCLLHLGTDLHTTRSVLRRPHIYARRSRVPPPARPRLRRSWNHVRVDRNGDTVSSHRDSVPRGVGPHRVGVPVRRARQPSLFCGVRSLCGMVVGGDYHFPGNGRHARSGRRVDDRRFRQRRSLHSLAVRVPPVGTRVSTRRRPRRHGVHCPHTRLDSRISVATIHVVGSCHTHTHMPVESTLSHTHRYSSYLLGLCDSWAYMTGSGRAPGRNKDEKSLTNSKRVQNAKCASGGRD